MNFMRCSVKFLQRLPQIACGLVGAGEGRLLSAIAKSVRDPKYYRVSAAGELSYAEVFVKGDNLMLSLTTTWPLCRTSVALDVRKTSARFFISRVYSVKCMFLSFCLKAAAKY